MMTDILVLDTEATGSSQNDVIIELAITNYRGFPIFNERFAPRFKRTFESTDMTGITYDDVKHERRFSEAVSEIESILQRKVVVIFNHDFDMRLLKQTCNVENISYSFTNDFMSINAEKCAAYEFPTFTAKDGSMSLSAALKAAGCKKMTERSALAKAQATAAIYRSAIGIDNINNPPPRLSVIKEPGGFIVEIHDRTLVSEFRYQFPESLDDSDEDFSHVFTLDDSAEESLRAFAARYNNHSSDSGE